MKINEIQESSDREYLNLPKEEIERLKKLVNYGRY